MNPGSLRLPTSAGKIARSRAKEVDRSARKSREAGGAPARDLPAAYVADWYFAAYADDLSFDNMGWLMPRVLELLALDAEAFFHGEEVALARLPIAGFPDDWPPSTYDLVRRFCHQWLIHRVRMPTPRY